MTLTILGVAGSSGSGKTSLAKAIMQGLPQSRVCLISLDSFYRPLSQEESAAAFNNEYDFDTPAAIDFPRLEATLLLLKSGLCAEIPIWSFSTHSRSENTVIIEPAQVLLLEGIFALHGRNLLNLLDIKIFCEADLDVCLSRRLVRDVCERERDLEGCIKQWFATVRPNHSLYGEAQRNVADIIVPRGMHNFVAIDMITTVIWNILRRSGASAEP